MGRDSYYGLAKSAERQFANSRRAGDDVDGEVLQVSNSLKPIGFFNLKNISYTIDFEPIDKQIDKELNRQANTNG